VNKIKEKVVRRRGGGGGCSKIERERERERETGSGMMDSQIMMKQSYFLRFFSFHFFFLPSNLSPFQPFFLSNFVSFSFHFPFFEIKPSFFSSLSSPSSLSPSSLFLSPPSILLLPFFLPSFILSFFHTFLPSFLSPFFHTPLPFFLPPFFTPKGRVVLRIRETEKEIRGRAEGGEEEEEKKENEEYSRRPV
jgi:hypothetical protein